MTKKNEKTLTLIGTLGFILVGMGVYDKYVERVAGDILLLIGIVFIMFIPYYFLEKYRRRHK